MNEVIMQYVDEEMMTVHRCACGEFTGEQCEWVGDMVVVEHMPECHRDSHVAANNSGVYPCNGSVRVVCFRGLVSGDLLST